MLLREFEVCHTTYTFITYDIWHPGHIKKNSSRRNRNQQNSAQRNQWRMIRSPSPMESEPETESETEIEPLPKRRCLKRRIGR